MNQNEITSTQNGKYATRLVPQDPNDKPTKTPFKKIHGGFNGMELEEKLPKGWILISFGRIRPSTKRFDPVRGRNKKYVGLEQIEKDTGKIIESRDSKSTVSSKTIFHEGDLLYGKLRPYLNKVAIAEFDGVCSSDILVFPQNPFIINTLLKYCLLQSDFVRFANSTATGVHHPRTSHKKLSDYNVPIPPISEQKRIVSKIESIFAQIDAAGRDLEGLASNISSARDSLGMLKGSILKRAFEGRLVPQDPSNEPAEVLFKSMHKNSENVEFETRGLPDGWIRPKIRDVCNLMGGGTPSRKITEYFGGNIIWITPTEIPKDRIITILDSREKITQLGLQKSSAKLIPSGSVLLTSRASIGFVAIAGIQMTTNQGFASFRCSDIIHNYFLAYWLWANRGLLVKNSTGTTFREIAKSTIKQLPIDLPPISEQKRIVSKIESIFSEIDAKQKEIELLELRIKSIPDSIAELKGSILKIAFDGKLVPQDPNEEPAEIMLKRLQASKVQP